MRIAVNYDAKGFIFQHFGHTEVFRIYDVNEENKVTHVTMLPTNGVTCHGLPEILKNINVDVLICGGIGQHAIENLSAANIKVVPGVEGDCDVAVAKFLAKELDFSLEANCKHEQGQVKRHSCHSHHDECHDCEH